MTIGLMRGVQPLGYVTQSSSRRGWISGKIPSPWLLLLCVLAGYFLGVLNSRTVPYQVDQVRVCTRVRECDSCSLLQ